MPATAINTGTAGARSANESVWRARRAIMQDNLLETSRKFATNETHAKIRYHLSHGMSRGALERIYGKQIVRDVMDPTEVTEEGKR